jgi:hypothetical protein
MRRRVTGGGVVLAVAVTAMVAVSGCARSVDGTAQKGAPDVPDPDRNYGYVDNRCGLLEDSTVAETLGADEVVRPYSGAVCQYVLASGPTMIDVTFSWFKSGSLARERAVAVERDAEVTDTAVLRHPAFVARDTSGPSACSVTAAAGPGVLSWWVQWRGEESEDACADAEKLLSATLSSDM